MTVKTNKSQPLYGVTLCVLISISYVFAIEHCNGTGNGPCGSSVSKNCGCTNGTVNVCCSGIEIVNVPKVDNQVTILELQNTSIDVLEKIPYPNLNALHLGYNKIHYIKDNAFEQLHKLQFLYLSHNNISGLTPKTFTGLKSLKTITLKLNPIYELESSVFGFHNTPNISEIDLEECRIYTIATYAFSQLVNLLYLNLSYNRLSTPPYFDIKDELRNLHTLDLTGNRLTHIDGYGLDQLPRLQKLFLGRNLITVIREHTLHGLEDSLVHLDLSDNKIHTIEPVAFAGMQFLHTLNIRKNQISKLVWEELPWDKLNEFRFSENPWICNCSNSWMVGEYHAMIHNFNAFNDTKCGSPASVKDQPVYSLDKSVFACPDPRKQNHNNNVTNILIAVSVVVSVVLLIVVGVFLYKKVLTKSGNKLNNPYYKVTANNGIHM